MEKRGALPEKFGSPKSWNGGDFALKQMGPGFPGSTNKMENQKNGGAPKKMAENRIL